MIYLVLAILGSIAIPFIIRLSKGKANNKYGMFLCNYLLSFSISLFVTGEFKPLSYGSAMTPVLIIGAITGCCYLASLTYYDLCIKKSGLVITSIFKKTSMVIPIMISVFIFKRALTTNHIIGIVLALIAIVLMNYQKGSFSKIEHLDILIINTVLTGVCEAGKNIFTELCGGSLTNYYITFLFGFASLSTIILVTLKKQKIGKYEILYGCAFGIPNYMNARFLTLSLATLNPVVVIPIYFMLTMVGTAMVGIVFFKEKVDFQKLVAMLIVVVATIILNA